MRGFGEETSGQHDRALAFLQDTGAGVGGDEAEAVGKADVLEQESAAAAVTCNLGEAGDLAAVLVLTSFSKSSFIFLPAMLCVSKAAARFSTTAAHRWAVPSITASLMV